MPSEYEPYSIESRFEGPGSTDRGNQVVISVVLERGAETHFSGIQVVVCCSIDEPRLRKLTVEDDVGKIKYTRRQWAREYEEPQREIELSARDRENVDLLLEQEVAHRASDTLLDQGLPALELPLYTVAYEVEDTSNSIWQCARLDLLRSWPTAHGTHRIVYQFVQLAHDPVVLYLSLSRSLRRSIYTPNQGPMGIFAFAVRVCPPQAPKRSRLRSRLRPGRRPFAQPPPEILSTIFGFFVADAEKTYICWRPAVLSLALVCRAWVATALEHLFHDFESFTTSSTDLMALSKALKAAPRMGGAIRNLSRKHFTWPGNAEDDAKRYQKLAAAFKDVIHAATQVQTLEIVDTHPSLRKAFMLALGKCSNVRSFVILPVTLRDKEREYRCRPTMPDLFRCFQRWPWLHTLQLYGWDGPNTLSQTVEQFTVEQTPPLDCALHKIRLAEGPITGPQLCNLTAGSHASLSDASFSDLVGLSNAGLKDWLFQVAPTLACFRIVRCSVARERAAEAYALDAAMGVLRALVCLVVDGDVVSELAVLRKPVGAPAPAEWAERGSIIELENCPGVRLDGLVEALRHTRWQQVSVRPLFDGNKPLLEEARAIAWVRGLKLR